LIQIPKKLNLALQSYYKARMEQRALHSPQLIIHCRCNGDAAATTTEEEKANGRENEDNDDRPVGEEEERGIAVVIRHAWVDDVWFELNMWEQSEDQDTKINEETTLDNASKVEEPIKEVFFLLHGLPVLGHLETDSSFENAEEDGQTSGSDEDGGNVLLPGTVLFIQINGTNDDEGEGENIYGGQHDQGEDKGAADRCHRSGNALTWLPFHKDPSASPHQYLIHFEWNRFILPFGVHSYKEIK